MFIYNVKYGHTMKAICHSIAHYVTQFNDISGIHYWPVRDIDLLKGNLPPPGSVVGCSVLGDQSQKVMSSSPGEDTWNNYFHFNCDLSYMGLPNNI